MGLFYTVPAPNQALVITGGRGATDSPGGLRIVTGQGALHIPILHRVYHFYIGSHSVRFNVEAQSAQNIAVTVEATVVFRVSNNKSSIAEAASRFLSSDVQEMKDMAEDIFSGQTRSVIGRMSVESIISDRDKLNVEVLETAEPKMSILGLQIDNFQINEISDRNNHIANLSKPELEKVRERAERAQAEAESSIEEARQKAEREKSLYKKDTDLQVSENTIETAAKRAEAKQSEPLADAEAMIKVTQTEKRLLEEQARAEKARLEVEVITPARAEAEALDIKARAEAESIKIRAEALSSHNGIILTEEIIKNIPDIANSMGLSLAESNLTVFNGADGITDLFTKSATMATSILNGVKLDNFALNTNNENTNDNNEKTTPKQLPPRILNKDKNINY